jgi:hypothetical protein
VREGESAGFSHDNGYVLPARFDETELGKPPDDQGDLDDFGLFVARSMMLHSRAYFAKDPKAKCPAPATATSKHA